MNDLRMYNPKWDHTVSEINKLHALSSVGSNQQNMYKYKQMNIWVQYSI